MEIWKPVPGTGGKIEVSDMGRVRSWLRGEPYILKTCKDKKGYHRLRVTLNREKKSYKLHRLVATAFIENPDNLPQVNHLDGNKDNNRADNLEWVTNQQNAQHAARTGLWDSVFVAANAVNARKRKAVIGMCNGVARCFSSVGEAERFVGSKHVTAVLKGKRPRAKGWTFVYKGGEDVAAPDH